MNEVKKIIRRYALDVNKGVYDIMKEVGDLWNGYLCENPETFTKLKLETVGNAQLILTIEGLKDDR